MKRHPLIVLTRNLLLAYILYMLCRVVYVAEFWDIYAASWSSLSLRQLLVGSLRFDTAAICYTHALYALMLLVPLPIKWKNSRGYQLGAKIYYVAVNAVMLSINLADTVYSRYTGRRTTWTFFSEFSNEGNLGNIFFIEVLHHWYLVLIGLAFIAALIMFGTTAHEQQRRHNFLRVIHGAGSTVAMLLLCIAGIRGGISTAVRPIAISNANQYVDQPMQAAIVLNTPFSLIRTCGKTTFTDPGYYSTEELQALYSPLHKGTDNSPKVKSRRNVVVIIVESLSQEYIGYYNPYKGYTPFLDSLISHSLTFRHSYANGRKSIDGMPSILSGIPMFVEPFFVTGYSLNNVSSIAGELSTAGYTTAFFHGAENGSMGFQAFARTSGFQRYYGRTEYDQDPRYGGEQDFDGTWAIWDEEFLQYYASTMAQLPQPFMTAVFTASSHHPFVVPERYRQPLHEEGHPMHTCIRYADLSLRRFFASAKKMDWYDSTIFVITGDHTNVSHQPAYANALGTFSVPIIIYDPSGQLPRGMSRATAQQTSIMPTILGALGYSQPYVAFGQDLLHTAADSTWALHYNGGIYQFVQNDTLLLFDGLRATAIYDLHNDPSLQHNLIHSTPHSRQTALVRAIIQSYMQRMINNKLTDTTQ